MGTIELSSRARTARPIFIASRKSPPGEASGFTCAAAGGIAVAIEAVILYNFLNTHVQKIALQFKLLAEEYLEILKELPSPVRAGREESA